jgi:tetratricopeptide (TPR) repeat protein
VVIDKFCSANKLGDEALKKKNCPLAKSYYQKAIALMSDEKYPVEQLAKAEDCIRQKQDEDAAAELARQARQAEIEKAAKEKAAKDAMAKSKTEKPAKEKAVQTKTAAEKPQKTETASNDIRPKETATKEADKGESGGKGNSKYHMPQVLGADKYKEAISRADNYFKSKRYQDAKAAYEEALKLKANDSYATGRISECNKQIGTN